MPTETSQTSPAAKSTSLLSICMLNAFHNNFFTKTIYTVELQDGHQYPCNLRRFTTRFKPLISLRNTWTKLQFVKQYSKKPAEFWNKVVYR